MAKSHSFAVTGPHGLDPDGPTGGAGRMRHDPVGTEAEALIALT